MKQTIPQMLEQVRAENRAAGEDAEPVKRELKRRKPLRRVSLKRARLNRKVNPIRHAFVEQVGTCMVCRKATATDPHEIASGDAREGCLSEIDLIMALCRSCHEQVQGWKPEIQIAARAAWLIDKQCYTYNVLKRTAQTHVTRVGVLTALEYAPGVKPVEKVKGRKRKAKKVVEK